jgi:RNA polymerase sigma-70 factor, ECF subfamily
MDDIEILQRVQAGDTDAFALIVQKYHRQLLNFIFRLTRDEQNVEDLGQEVFLGLYKSIRTFDIQRGIPFSAWLFITARNRCVSELRKRRRQIFPLDGFADNLPARGKTPEQDAGEAERLAAIRDALDQLPEPYRGTILQSLRGDSPEEIALNNRISRGTVKSRLARAREKLRVILHPYLGGKSYDQF